MACAMKQLFKLRPSTLCATVQAIPQLSSPPAAFTFLSCNHRFPKYSDLSCHSKLTPVVCKASPENDAIVASGEDDDGVSLGTMKLPLDTDIARFELLIFQWANSLCQGANLPLPVPLKVDKIAGGARLGFITIGDGQTDVPVYIDCLVFPAASGSAPIFRAIRNGRLKDQTAPGEQRIMRSLLPALKKSVQLSAS